MQDQQTKEEKMEMRSHFFSEQIAEIIEEIIKDFEESNPDDPIKWFKDAVKRHCLLNDEETERVSKELLKGIVSYKKAKKLDNPFDAHKDKINDEDLRVLKEELDIIKNSIKEEVQTWKEKE